MRQPYAIGVDLSYTSTGIAWPGTVDTFTTKPEDGTDIIRAAHIRNHVVAHATDATIIAIENGVHRSHNAFRAGILHGIVREGLALLEGPKRSVLLVPPAALKKYATGRGNANKTEMVVAARDCLGYDGTDDNEADALWLRAIGEHVLGSPVADATAYRTKVLESLKEQTT